MKGFLLLIVIFSLCICPHARGEEPKPVMVTIGEEVHKVTAERAFTNDDAAHVAQHLFALLVGPPNGKPFADVTEPDAKHIEVNVGYDMGMIVRSYHVRFFREPVMKQDVYIESILVATHNI